MSLTQRSIESFKEGRLTRAILDRLIGIPHVYLFGSDSYIINLDGVEIDLAGSSLPAVQKYRLRKGASDYESAEVNYIKEFLPSQGDVIDLGAGMGVTACIAGKICSGTILALEANPALLPILQRNSEINSGDIEIIHAAYSPDEATVSFNIDTNSFQSSSIHIDSGTQTEVKAVNLHWLVEEYDIDTFSLVSDIEGSEVELIQKEFDVIRECCQVIIMEFHPDKHPDSQQILTILNESEFELQSTKGDVRVYTNPKYLSS